MTTIIESGDTHYCYPCTAIPSPQEAEISGMEQGKRVPAILCIVAETGYRFLSWADPALLDGRSVIDGDNGSDEEQRLAEEIIVCNYAYTDSLDYPLDYEAIDTAIMR